MERDVSLTLFCLGSLFFLVGEVGYSSFKKKVVPCKKFLDIGCVDTIGIEIGKNRCKILTNLLVGAKRLYINGLCTGLLLDGLKDTGKRSIALNSVDRHIGQGNYLVVGVGRSALAVGKRLNDEHILATVDKTEKTGAAGYG